MGWATAQANVATQRHAAIVRSDLFLFVASQIGTPKIAGTINLTAGSSVGVLR